MLPKRLKHMRLSKGYSLQELSNAMDNMVTKQALSKYEKGLSTPSPSVLAKLALIYDVNTASLIEESSEFTIEFLEFRKKKSLKKKEEERIKHWIQIELDKRLAFFDLISYPLKKIPSIKVNNLKEAEKSAKKLRELWSLGSDSIANLRSIIEAHNIHVIVVDASSYFDGISISVEKQNEAVSAAIVTRSNISGERQRFNLAHELAHIVQQVDIKSTEKDKESFANRFAGSFLVPAETLKCRVGERRKWVSSTELILLKKEFGISIQALLYRMLDIKIITPSYYKEWCIKINKKNWRKKEPNPLAFEEPTRFNATVLRALSEEWISEEEAEDLLGKKVKKKEPQNLIYKRDIARMPLEEKKHLLEEASKALASAYEEDESWKELQLGELIEY